MPDGDPSVAIVMPAYQAAHLLDRSLAAAMALEADEVIVVDAGSTDETGRVADRLGARVVRLEVRTGPAGARNAGVAVADADVVLFLDADCVADSDVVRRVRDAFAAEPDLVSLTGSYDDAPLERNWASLYMNLRHHFTHQRARRENATFWAGCGAVRRDAFLACGGFDAQRFPEPMIEDIELGHRLQERGTSRLDPKLQVKHLKHWSYPDVVRTDVFKRAVPWSRLILESGEMPNDLNLQWRQRLAALISPLALISVIAVPTALILGQRILALAGVAIVVASIVLDVRLYRFFADRGGVAFAVVGWLYHQIHLFYSAATFALCSLAHRLRRKEAP